MEALTFEFLKFDTALFLGLRVILGETGGFIVFVDVRKDKVDSEFSRDSRSRLSLSLSLLFF